MDACWRWCDIHEAALWQSELSWVWCRRYCVGEVGLFSHCSHTAVSCTSRENTVVQCRSVCHLQGIFRASKCALGNLQHNLRVYVKWTDPVVSELGRMGPPSRPASNPCRQHLVGGYVSWFRGGATKRKRCAPSGAKSDGGGQKIRGWGRAPPFVLVQGQQKDCAPVVQNQLLGGGQKFRGWGAVPSRIHRRSSSLSVFSSSFRLVNPINFPPRASAATLLLGKLNSSGLHHSDSFPCHAAAQEFNPQRKC